MSPYPRIHLILPAFNEGANISPLFKGFEELPATENYRFHLINDGSTDNTLEAVGQIDKSLDLNLINHPKNLGLSKTLLSGILAALAESTDDDVLVFMDGDNTHLPSQVPELVSAIKSGADIAIASRYQPGATIEGLSYFRKSFSVLASVLFRTFLPIQGVKDFSCGFRAIRARLLKQLSKEELETIFSLRGFACTTGLLLSVTRDKSVTISEIPMKLKYNQKRGVSKMNLSQTSIESLKLIGTEWLKRYRAH
jgi:dolichol-phosphate mannosyltransferase